MSSVTGWSCWEDPRGAYEIGTDSKVTHVGKQSGFVSAKKTESGYFGAIMQKVNADQYKGKRIRFSAFLKCEGVNKSCGLFMEVFKETGDAHSSLLGLDNMSNRKVSGNTDWTKYSLVLDAPTEAFGINIGARLIGPGKLWIDGVSFEEVGNDIPTTDELNSCRYPTAPQNLSFEEN
jgi:hypothetical protein